MSLLNPLTWSLSVKFSLTITAVVAGVGFMIGAVIVAQDWMRFHSVLGEKAVLLAESLAATAPKAILRKDFWSLYMSLKHIAPNSPTETQQNQVISAMILDADGRVQAHLQPSKNPIGLQFSPADENEQRLLEEALTARIPIVLSSGGISPDGFQEGVIPLFSDQKYLGVVRVRLSIGPLFEKATNSAVTVLAMTFGLVIFGSILGAIASQRMIRPLTAVTLGLEAVGRGDIAEIAPIHVREGDEIGRLSATCNKIMAELAEKEILEKEAAMSEKLVALGRISAGVAHEVNNPLAGLLNCIDTLRKHPNDPELIARYLPVIEQGLHRIKDIVSSLLVELKVEDNDQQISAAHLDHLRELLEVEIGDRNIEIIWENEVDESIYIQGTRAQQIVLNLLKNAVQALSEGGTVSFRAFHEQPYMTMEVRDNGPGIPVPYRSQLFDPFFTTKPTGSGLGLWVVYRLVQSMEGVIEVESEEGHGTLFRVVVPAIDMKVA